MEKIINYKKLQIIDSKKQLSTKELEDFSKLFIVKPPHSFIKLYSLYNGGGLSEENQEKELWKLPILGFSPIKYGNLSIEKLIEEIQEIKSQEFGVWEKGEFIPFAYDMGGHTIFLSLKKDDKGIYFFDYDSENFIQLSSCFDGFLKELYGASKDV